MNRKIYFLFFLLLLCSAPAYANAVPWTLSKEDLKHVHNANYAANRDRWKDAMIHAKRADDPIVYRVFQWRKFLSHSRHVSFNEIAEFLEKYPGWPREEEIRKRAEVLMHGTESPERIIVWFTKHVLPDDKRVFHTPQTARGKLMLAEAILGTEDKDTYKYKVQALIRESWIEGNYSVPEAEAFLEDYEKTWLQPEDHVARIEQLIDDDRIAEAQRSLGKVSKDYRLLFTARIRLNRYNFGLDKAITDVPERFKGDEGLVYDRINWREKRKKTDGVLELLPQIPEKVSQPRKWWKLRKKYTQMLLKEGQVEKAYGLVKNHSFTEDVVGLSNGEWLAGWIAYYHLKDYRQAYKHFYNIFQYVESPISRGRAAYWAGFASEKNGNANIARQWYEKASRYPTSYYGQLATEKLGQKNLDILRKPTITQGDIKRYKDNTMMQAAYVMAKVGKFSTARVFIKHAVNTSNSAGEQALITQFGQAFDRLDIGIAASKEAIRNDGPVLLENYFPVIALNNIHGKPITAPEPAFIHAIILQESIFIQDAKSYAGALGLMQLLPSTARDMARVLRVKFQKAKLYKDPRYNIMLGSRYLEYLLKKFDGSYILAIAAYNGGATNVKRWIKAHGDPRTMDRVEDVIAWIEQIPFAETQNYVQRVIENMQIYRHRLQPDQPAYLHVSEDIMR